VYPSRCHPQRCSTRQLPPWASQVYLCGRLVGLEEGRGWLADAEGAVDFTWLGGTSMPARRGDIVELMGRVVEGQLEVLEMRLLAPALRPWEAGEWQRFNANDRALQKNLQVRAAVLGEIRRFFAEQGFLEVETPVLARVPGQEVHIELFETDMGEGTPACLLSSPEHHMKRLLGVGLEKIFQVGRAFRRGERSALHHPEFTLLEWYRAYASYEEIMADAEELVAGICRAVLGRERIAWRGQDIELNRPWPRLSVNRAFGDYAGLDLHCCASVAEFRQQALALGYASIGATDSWEDIFHKVLLEKVEPALKDLGAVFLVDYPSSMAALAKLKSGDPRLAERAELYVGGVELANGFTELNDPAEQRRRFVQAQGCRQQQGSPVYPLDEEFLAMMERAMPPAGGMALGVDRLVMLLVDAACIDQVMAFSL
jgi:lysyl-tRNA synthetase class 2